MKKSFVFAVLAVLFLSASFVIAKDNAGAFRLILMPDTQTYAVRNHPDIFHSQTEWVVNNPDGVAYVLQQGDITNNNRDDQWELAKAVMERLDGKVPYMFAFGNHDYGKNGIADTRDTNGYKYFSFEKFANRADFGGTFEGKIDNIWQTFKAGGIDWLVMSLEFGPRSIVLDWANKVVAAHPNHKVIVNTHAYMYSDDTRMGEGDKWLPQGYGLGKSTGDNAVNDGEAMWDKFVSLHPNIFIVVSGHVINDGTGKLVSEGKNGNKVYQMLANYQGGIVNPETGGDGYLRILTLDPTARTIDVKTYSPHLNKFKTEDDQQFRFDDVAF